MEVLPNVAVQFVVGFVAVTVYAPGADCDGQVMGLPVPATAVPTGPMLPPGGVSLSW